MHDQVAIRYFPHEEDEIMHGLGVRSSSYNASRVRHTGGRVHLRRSHSPSGSVYVSVETAPSNSRVSKDSAELSDNTETTYSGGCQSSVRLAAQQAKVPFQPILPHSCSSSDQSNPFSCLTLSLVCSYLHRMGI